jgi:hypothetical protein
MLSLLFASCIAVVLPQQYVVWFGLVWFGNLVIQNATKGDFGELISPKINSTFSGNAANNVSTLQVKST